MNTSIIQKYLYRCEKYEHSASLVALDLVVEGRGLQSCVSFSSWTSTSSYSSPLTSQKLWSTQQAAIIVLMLFMWQSYIFIKHLHLPFSMPNALSTLIRALLRRLLKVICAGVVCWFSGYGFISHGSNGYAASPKITTGTSTPSNLSVIWGNSASLWPLSNKDELAKTLALWTLPGQPTLMSQNRSWRSTTPCRITE